MNQASTDTSPSAGGIQSPRARSNQTPVPDNFTGPLAILSDIHGNIDALTAVLADADEQGCGDMVCLGDIVGYGPAPGTCLRLIRERCSVVVMGNHEDMALSLSRDELTGGEEAAGLWSSLALCQKDLKEDEKGWMGQLPLSATSGQMTFVHASLEAPGRFDYIHCKVGAREHFAAQDTFISFHGHTHVPVVWEKAEAEVLGYVPEAAPAELSPGRLYAVNVGSVGQPRDGDPRAAYAIYHPEERRLVIRRVEYDVARARRRFSSRGLTGFHSRRLVEGM